MATRMTTDQFIQKANAVHGNRYGYNDEYVSAHVPIAITCPTHGEFMQRPYCHTLLKQGCPACGVETSHKTTRATLDKFVARAIAVHGDRYDYSKVEYTTNKAKVDVVCHLHGVFTITPNSHLCGIGCRPCGYAENAVGTDEFVRRATARHGNKYVYDNVVYQRIDKKVDIVCPVHGIFKQTPQAHLNGTGCPHCAKMNRQGGFSEEYFLVNPQRKYVKGLLYVVRLYDETEDFVKVGITTQTVHKRFSGNRSVYACDVIHEETMTIYDAFCTEQRLLTHFAPLRYIPRFRFAGWTECVKAQPQEIVALI